MDKKVRVHIFVKGFVQGVFFRVYTREEAEKLGILGWVRNSADGKVEAVFEGEKEKIEKMIDWVKKGPSSARVDEVDIKFEEYKGEFKNFQIKRD